MATKVQPQIFTFKPLPAKKCLVDPLSLFKQIRQDPCRYKKRIDTAVLFLSKSNMCGPATVPIFLNGSIRLIFLHILGKRIHPTSKQNHPYYGKQFLKKGTWNESDKRIFESARVACLEIMQSTYSECLDTGRIIEEWDADKASIMPVAMLAHIFSFIESKPGSFLIIKSISKSFYSQVRSLTNPEEVRAEQLSELIRGLKGMPTITEHTMQELFAKSPFLSDQHRFAHFILQQTPKIGETNPDFFNKMKASFQPHQDMAKMDQIICQIAEEFPIATRALIQSAADAFEKEMRVTRSLLPKDPG